MASRTNVTGHSLSLRPAALATVLGMALGLAACSAGATPSASSPPAGSASPAASPATSPSPAASSSAAVSPSPAASPSPSTALSACLDKEAYDILKSTTDMADQTTAEDLAQHASALIAALKAWAPPAAFDADYRDQVVAKLEAADYAGALVLISAGLATAEWQVTPC